MRIVVLLKQVPVLRSDLKGSADLRDSDGLALSYEMNGPDAFALEQALFLREQQGGEVVVVSAGPSRVERTLHDALARGADRAIRIPTSTALDQDAYLLAEALAGAITPEQPDLVLTGLQSEDHCAGQTGVLLAELAGWAHATIVTQIWAGIGEVRVKRELEGGWSQFAVLPVPAVLTVQSGPRKLRLPSLLGIKRAKGKELRIHPAPLDGQQANPSCSIDSVSLPAARDRTRFLSGDAQECARRLLEQLRFEARVL